MIKTNIKTGQVVKIFYFNTLKKYRRIFNFVGICVKNNKKTQTITLENYYANEFVTLNFLNFSPNIFTYTILKQYNFKTKFSKFYHHKKIKLRSKKNVFQIKYKQNTHELTNFLMKPPVLLHKEKKRLRNKFRL